MHKLQVHWKIFTINFCLSHEQPKGNVCLYHKSLYVQYDVFHMGEHFPRSDNNAVITELVFVWRKCCRASSFYLLHVFFSLHLHSVNSSLASLVRIILCPLHDCYKLCKQRQRCKVPHQPRDSARLFLFHLLWYVTLSNHMVLFVRYPFLAVFM